MKLAIMQPYFFPYIGYYQLINSVSEFILHTDVQYTKKGFINRNRILFNFKDRVITLPIKKDSWDLNIVERKVSDTWEKDKLKLLNLISLSYTRAPFFDSAYPMIEECLLYNDRNLGEFLCNCIQHVCNYLGINTKIVDSSNLEIDSSLKAQKKVIEICKVRGADEYINMISGKVLYNGVDFKSEGINLRFLSPGKIKYRQFSSQFVESLSIIDVIMFNSRETVKKMLCNYKHINLGINHTVTENELLKSAYHND